jgi:hypothetical protein
MKKVVLAAQIGPRNGHCDPFTLEVRASTFRGAMGAFSVRSRDALVKRAREMQQRMKLRFAMNAAFGKFGRVVYEDADSVFYVDTESSISSPDSKPVFKQAYTAPKLYRLSEEEGRRFGAMQPDMRTWRG